MVLLHVVEPLTQFASLLSRDEDYESLLADQRREGEDLLEEITNRLGDQPLKFELVIQEGKPARSISKYANNIDADMIIIGAGEVSGGEIGALGSVTHALLHETERPVLVVH